MRPRKTLAAVAVVAALLVATALIRGGGDEAPSSRGAKRDDVSPRRAVVHAATRFLTDLDTPTLLDDAARQRFVSRWASRRSEQRLQQLYAEEANRAKPLEAGYSRAAMLGYRVDQLGARSAQVTVWALSVASVGDLPAAVGWRTLSVSLVPEKRKWKVARVREVPGLSPDSPPAEFRRRAEQFEEYRLAP